MRDRARKLRASMTDAERRLWRHLRLRQLQGLKFRRQVPIGPYIVDFVSFEARLIIEVDGGQNVERAMEDARRTAWLNERGFEVLRFWDNEVLLQSEAVQQAIYEKLSPHPNPPPQGGREKGPRE
ncbi:MAG: hypothetical protein A2X36_00620 [Elusimicrobia bacterium GWA2_69_24]|nr:MAG: hypothetical protein A2X36_00620 [Elusimicrobia bacterium GWA2_69_24]HBL16983.1 ATP-dependent helicase HrpA [Elusimicrobiota bacterium]